jgi:hypothetical protein
MRYPQILMFESDGLLAGMLRETAKTNRWALREPRRPEACLRLLRSQCPTVLVLKIATQMKREPGLPIKEEEQRTRAQSREREQIRSMELLDQIHWWHPDTAIVVVGDAEDVSLTGLAWELGGNYVLMPPQSRQQLPDLVAVMMKEAIRKQIPAGKNDSNPPRPPSPQAEKREVRGSDQDEST